MAFPPDYTASGLAYVFVTGADGSLQIREFRRSPSDPNRAEPGAGRLVLSQAHAENATTTAARSSSTPTGCCTPASATAARADDPDQNGQNLDTLLGKLIRIDPRQTAGGAPYSVPPGNPFAGTAPGRDEIWAYGLRNPYRFSFDRQTGDLWIGDVGQDTREEVDRAAAGVGGQNYGWRCYEGTIPTPTIDHAVRADRPRPAAVRPRPRGRRGLLDHRRLRRPRPRAARRWPGATSTAISAAGDPVRHRERRARHRDRPVGEQPRLVRAGRLRPALHGLAQRPGLPDPRRRRHDAATCPSRPRRPPRRRSPAARRRAGGSPPAAIAADRTAPRLSVRRQHPAADPGRSRGAAHRHGLGAGDRRRIAARARAWPRCAPPRTPWRPGSRASSGSPRAAPAGSGSAGPSRAAHAWRRSR